MNSSNWNRPSKDERFFMRKRNWTRHFRNWTAFTSAVIRSVGCWHRATITRQNEPIWKEINIIIILLNDSAEQKKKQTHRPSKHGWLLLLHSQLRARCAFHSSSSFGSIACCALSLRYLFIRRNWPLFANNRARIAHFIFTEINNTHNDAQ